MVVVVLLCISLSIWVIVADVRSFSPGELPDIQTTFINAAMLDQKYKKYYNQLPIIFYTKCNKEETNREL